MQLSVIIPAYNEQKRISSTLQKVDGFLKSKAYDYEILVIDDCSNDSTLQIVKSLKIKKCRILHNKVNKGKGYSVRKGILNARYDNILFTDSDMATPIEEFDKFRKKLGEYDIIIASRNLKESDIRVHQPIYRQFLGKSFPYLVSLIVIKGFKDTQCGFKLMKRKPALQIAKKMLINRFAFDVELLYIAKKLGYKILEMPVVWIDKGNSKVNPIKDSLKMLFDLLRIRCNIIRNRYNI